MLLVVPMTTQEIPETPPTNSIVEDGAFNKVKVYIPKTKQHWITLRDASSLVAFSKKDLTRYTDFSHSYQLIQDDNEDLQLEEIQYLFPEENMDDVAKKQRLTLITEEEELKFESRRDGIGGHASCPLSNAEATDPTEATRYLLAKAIS